MVNVIFKLFISLESKHLGFNSAWFISVNISKLLQIIFYNGMLVSYPEERFALIILEKYFILCELFFNKYANDLGCLWKHMFLG